MTGWRRTEASRPPTSVRSTTATRIAASEALQEVGSFRPVRVLADSLDRVLAVGLVDADSARGTDAMGVQEQHDPADYPLLGPAGDDALRSLRPDPRHLMEPLRRLLDQVEHRLAERAHQLLRVE